jgi:ornithine cyclodeaminase
LKVLLLSRRDVIAAGGTDTREMIPVIEEVFRTHASKEYCQPLKPYLRIPGDTENRRMIAMPVYLGRKFNVWGIKWIASNPTNPFKRNLERASATIILNDVETGFPVAIMEGAAISATRTAAVAAVSAKYLATADPSVLGVVGAGVIARAVIKGLRIVKNSIQTVKVFDLDLSRAESMCEELQRELEIDVRVVSTAQEAMEDADVLVPATTATTPYIEGEWIASGALFINISLRDPKFSVVQRASKIVVDDWVQVNRENTVLHLMYEQGLLKDEDIYAELGEIIAGAKAGRDNDHEIIFFNPMGMAAEDIGVAEAVYRNAKHKLIGTYVDL